MDHVSAGAIREEIRSATPLSQHSLKFPVMGEPGVDLSEELSLKFPRMREGILLKYLTRGICTDKCARDKC